MGPSAKDLICLVADNNMRQTLRALFDRPDALSIRPVAADIVVHPEHDPGCFLRSPDFLRSFVNRAEHALVLFDREGCGRENSPRAELEVDLGQRLSQAGWNDRARAIAIVPELEI